jgi:hypothetical protein
MPVNDNCFPNRNGSGVYYPEVRGALDTLRQQKPDFFENNRIRQINKYFDGMIRVLEEEYGLCAVRGGEGFPSDELGIKRDNGSSEQWDIMAGGADGGQYIIWDYKVTCKPARF